MEVSGKKVSSAVGRNTGNWGLREQRAGLCLYMDYSVFSAANEWYHCPQFKSKEGKTPDLVTYPQSGDGILPK